MANHDADIANLNFMAIRAASTAALKSTRAVQKNLKDLEKIDLKDVFEKPLKTLRTQANRSLQGALEGLILEGKSFRSVFRQFAASLTQNVIRQSLNINPFAYIQPFARGGILNAPTLFPLTRRSAGLAGEAGPEAIMPLARGADGRLGVRAESHVRPVTVQVNIQTPDLESFRRAQTQTAALIRRAVIRGQRNQ